MLYPFSSARLILEQTVPTILNDVFERSIIVTVIVFERRLFSLFPRRLGYRKLPRISPPEYKPM